jgi:hypothetical protein
VIDPGSSSLYIGGYRWWLDIGSVACYDGGVTDEDAIAREDTVVGAGFNPMVRRLNRSKQNIGAGANEWQESR